MTEALDTTEPLLATLSDRAQQISIEASPNDARQVGEQVEGLKTKLEDLKQDVEARLENAQLVLSERQDFQQDLDQAMDWLLQREKAIAAREPLGMELENTNNELQKHQVKNWILICIFS